MSRIKILPEILSNKIAAGEVVERPASVVKELVENSLDAHSRRIIVEVEKGGRALIRVSDNGIGMGHDDALLALERYATSKIYTDQDLFSIRTLGFRGEALPSIAAVSRFEMITRHQAADSGTEILVDGGKIKKVSETGAPTGTMITVKQLFFNTPARRKFMKSAATEMSHIADHVARIALARPDVQFRLVHNNRTVKHWPVAATSFQRVIDVIGNDLQDDLHPMEFARPGVTITGWISSPRVSRSTSRGVHIYVNRRFVRDRIIQHALFQGYSQRLVKGQFPVAVVFVDVAPDTVDVNVHPTKNEVRFSRQHDVHASVKQAVAKALYAVDRPDWSTARRAEGRQHTSGTGVSEAARGEFGMRPATSSAGSNAECGKKREPFESFESRMQANLPDGDVYRMQPATRYAQIETDSESFAKAGRQAGIWHAGRFSDLRMLGQFRNTYIVCESDDSLILIDQHAAHERILFEKLRDRSQSAPKAAQQLLVPETVDLGFREAHALGKVISELSPFGLMVEPFGGSTFIVKSVPAFLGGREVKPLIVEIAESLAAVGHSSGLHKALEQCCRIIACHGAIRANQQLSDRQISGLLEQLDACDNPSHCPHGRPTWIKWDQNTLEKLFKRIV